MTTTHPPQIPLRAVFMHGGTSRALFFRAEDLPPAGPTRDAMILAAMGSPDPNKRQLDGHEHRSADDLNRVSPCIKPDQGRHVPCRDHAT